MKFIGMILSFILLTAAYWAPIAVGIAVLIDGQPIGILFIALGLWLVFRT